MRRRISSSSLHKLQPPDPSPDPHDAQPPVRRPYRSGAPEQLRQWLLVHCPGGASAHFVGLRPTLAAAVALVPSELAEQRYVAAAKGPGHGDLCFDGPWRRQLARCIHRGRCDRRPRFEPHDGQSDRVVVGRLRRGVHLDQGDQARAAHCAGALREGRGRRTFDEDATGFLHSDVPRIRLLRGIQGVPTQVRPARRLAILHAPTLLADPPPPPWPALFDGALPRHQKANDRQLERVHRSGRLGGGGEALAVPVEKRRGCWGGGWSVVGHRVDSGRVHYFAHDGNCADRRGSVVAGEEGVGWQYFW